MEGVRPARFVAEAEHLEGANGEIITIWRPLDARDNVIVGGGAIKLAAVLVPNSVSAIFSARHNNVIARVPIAAKYNTVMSFPSERFVAWESGNDR